MRVGHSCPTRREAAKEYSPRRKPWVPGRIMNEPRRGERRRRASQVTEVKKPEALLRHQPIHRLFPRIERRQVPLREALEVLVEHMRQTLRPHPRRLLDVRTIQHQNLLRLGRDRKS